METVIVQKSLFSVIRRTRYHFTKEPRWETLVPALALLIAILVACAYYKA
jgi:hypothetical protein